MSSESSEKTEVDEPQGTATHVSEQPTSQEATSTEEKPVEEQETAPGAEESPDSEKKSRAIPGLRVQIGSLSQSHDAQQARPKPEEIKPGPDVQAPPKVSPQAAPVKTPKPTRQMTPELEQEIEAALGGMSLDDMLSGSMPSATEGELEPESRVTGRVVSVHRDDVFVDLGGQNQGAVSLKQFEEPPEPGTALEVVVSRFDAEEGLYELTLPGAAVEVGDWSEIDEGMIVQATVTGHNKGGLECTVNNIRAFMPISQIALFRVEDLEPFVGESFACLVTEANPERRNLVLSRRAVLEREKAEAKEKMMDQLAVGQVHEGIVRSLQPFGAFVDLGGIDGLIHISQLSWDRVEHPSDVLEVGQKVRVRIEKFDKASGKIGLAYRDLAESPWDNVTSKYAQGMRVDGKVSKIMDFGAFVKLEPGVEGLIHISELAHTRVHRVSDVLSEGQAVEVQVLSVDPEKQRISLSLKAMEAKPTQKSKEQEAEEQAIAELEAAPAPQKKHKGPLKGGLGGPSGGEQFGLKW